MSYKISWKGCMSGRTEVVTALIHANASLNIHDNENRTALILGIVYLKHG